VAQGLTKTQSQVLSRVRSAVPVLPPRLAVLEIIVLLVIPALLEWLWPPFPDFTTFQPHPYWAAILILSLQYGTVSGLLAAAVAVIATVLIGLPEPDIGENHFAYLMRAWTQPVLWIAAALILGHFRMRQIEQRNELTRIVDELHSRSATLTTQATGLQTRCNTLERRLATRPKSDTAIYLDGVAALWNATPEQVPAHFDAALQAAFPGARAAIYAHDGHTVRLVARSNPQGLAPVSVGADSALAQSMARGEDLSLVSGLHDDALQGFGVFALPLTLPTLNQQVVQRADASNARFNGFILIESMPPAMINRNIDGRLQVVAQTLFSAHERPRESIAMGSNLARTAQSLNAAPPVLDAQRAATAVITIPEVRSWRQLRWLPHALRAKSPATEPQHEPPSRFKTPSSTSQ
jgi:hypothetical protein